LAIAAETQLIKSGNFGVGSELRTSAPTTLFSAAYRRLGPFTAQPAMVINRHFSTPKMTRNTLIINKLIAAEPKKIIKAKAINSRCETVKRFEPMQIQKPAASPSRKSQPL
jgi:hypothetical protein